MRVLLVEDDHVLGAAIRDHLAAEGHGVDWMKRIDDAMLAIDAVGYELVLLDLGLPDGRGLSILEALRERGNNVPVIIATAQDQIAMRIEGLNSGADDYLVKPFDLNEMSARLDAVARRSAGSGSSEIVIGDVKVDLGRKIIQRKSRPVVLTSREWAVLERLLRNRGGVVPKPDIEDSLYEFGAEIESNAVEVYVSRLRKKLGRELILTIRGIGYQVSTS